ncbi:hypothetical protein HQ590_03175 [bacterium]|nr:hypothetical protein [bacterium]
MTRDNASPEGTSVTLKRLVFLIHPLCYAGVSPREQDRQRRAYGRRERAVAAKWDHEIGRLGADAFLVMFAQQAADPQHPVGLLAQHAGERLGRRFLAITRRGRFDGASFAEWTREFQDVIRQRGFRYDAQTVRSEGWGESFDGCVAGFAAFLSGTLRLATPVEVRFALTVPDMPLLVSARLLKRERLPVKQVRLFLFEDARRRPVALFMPEVCRDGLKPYDIAVRADPAKLAVYTKQGHRVEPAADGTGGPDSQPPRALCRRTDDGLAISLRRDVPQRFFGGQREGPLFFVGENLSLQELRAIACRAQLTERPRIHG